MKSPIAFRILIDIIAVLAIIHGWWIVAVPLALLGTFVFSFYVEAFLLGLKYDALFGFVSQLGNWSYAGTIAGLVIFFAGYFLRSSLRRN